MRVAVGIRLGLLDMAVEVPLYRTADVDAFVDAHPETDWKQLRQVGKGQRSPLAALATAKETAAV
ncbi:hypothetical protein AB0A05_35525 [Streptomyces sp. NPDC046374]|uniref:hypothetical protein n=1 Tax=Streptomyces sp. NPDC046374 TaxID=3154917 RepID=UPI0033EE9D54